MSINAHTPSLSDPEEWHSLADHLTAVADKASRFGSKFNLGDVCHLMGLLHDVGKADPSFQDYLLKCAAGRKLKSTPHAATGAEAASSMLGVFVLAILGHHSRLVNVSDFRSSLKLSSRYQLKDVRQEVDAVISEVIDDSIIPQVRNVIKNISMDECAYFVRMCFSALVDADFLDTEHHFSPEITRLRGQYPDISYYKSALDEYMQQKTSNVPNTPVNMARAKVLSACREKAQCPPGVYRLTVPTGGGKTLSSLTFALDHAVKWNKDRVIVAVPYTSIIEQTADVFSGIFGDGKILEHHSAMDPDLSTTEDMRLESLRKLAASNWDCPVIVTTTVQLFESLLGIRPGKVRKVHNIANSVLILDEVQTLPSKLLALLLNTLGILVERFGCTVVMCTATQPSFGFIPKVDKVGTFSSKFIDSPEIVEDYDELYTALHRVDYEYIDKISLDELASALAAQDQVLCIVNTKRDAIQLINALGDMDSVYHLSTLLCPDHRHKVLQEIRNRLINGLPVRLVSTQVVEAGVDLDFPRVYRVLGPLDRIIQAAGRCNREGKLESGLCSIVNLVDSKTPPGDYRTGRDIALQLISTANDIDNPDCIKRYFDILFSCVQTDKDNLLDKHTQCEFETVAHGARLIADATVPVVMRQYAPREVDRLRRVKPEHRHSKWYQDIAKYSVNIFYAQRDQLISSGELVPIDEGDEECDIFIYLGPYGKLIGFGERDTSDG